MSPPCARCTRQSKRELRGKTVMLFDGRATILADGPLTAVAAFRASAGECAAAYSPHQAHRVVETLCRDAEGGDRHVLVDICQLLFDQSSFRPCNISTAVFAERVRVAVSRGCLLLVPGWPWMPGYASTPPPEANVAATLTRCRAFTFVRF